MKTKLILLLSILLIIALIVTGIMALANEESGGEDDLFDREETTQVEEDFDSLIEIEALEAELSQQLSESEAEPETIDCSVIGQDGEIARNYECLNLEPVDKEPIVWPIPDPCDGSILLREKGTDEWNCLDYEDYEAELIKVDDFDVEEYQTSLDIQ